MKFTAQIPGELRFRDVAGTMLRAVCQCVESTRRFQGLEWRVVSAFNEAFNNIVAHGTSGEVEVHVDVDDDRLQLLVVDGGPAFDFEASGARGAPPPIDALDEGGMGLFIIRTVVSAVTYKRDRDRNLLTMTQRFSECAQKSEAPLPV